MEMLFPDTEDTSWQQNKGINEAETSGMVIAAAGLRLPRLTK